MANLEQLKLELELKLDKKEKVEALLEAAKAKYKQMDEVSGKHPRTMFLYSVGSGVAGGLVGFFGATAIRGSTVATYLGKAENLEMTNEMMELTGATTVEELKEFMLHDGGELGKYLYETSGAQDYFGTISLEMIAVAAIAGGALFGIPAVYKYAKAKRKNNCYKEIMRCNSECDTLTRECESLQSMIDVVAGNSNVVGNTASTGIADNDKSIEFAADEQMSR